MLFFGLLIAFMTTITTSPIGAFAQTEVDHSAHEGMGGASDHTMSSMHVSTSSNSHHHLTPQIIASEENSPKLFKYKAAIDISSAINNFNSQKQSEKSGIFEAILPLEIMSKVQAGDIKIICSDGSEIPFLMLDGERVTPWHTINANLERYPQKDGGLITILDVGKDGMMHHGVYLQMPVDAHTGQTVSIYGSDSPLPMNSPRWLENELKSDGKIFAYIDSGSSQQIKSNYVDYKQTRARYLKVVTKPEASFGSVGSSTTTERTLRGLLQVEPYNILAALVQTVPSRYVNRDVRVFDIASKEVDIKINKENKENGFTQLNIDLGLDNIYTYEFTLKLSDAYGENIPQFIRKYELEKSKDNRNWAKASEGDIYNLKNEILDAKDLTVRYSETRDRFFRLKIYDAMKGFGKGDGIAGATEAGPIDLKFKESVDFKSFARSLIFEVENGMTYDLYFGNTSLSKTFYDKQLLRKYATSSVIGLLEVGPLEKNPLYEGGELFQGEWLMRERVYKGILGGLLILGLGAVGVWGRRRLKS